MKKILLLSMPLAILLWLLFLPACHKDKDDKDCPEGLPCATQEGAQTFGCYIDGKPWAAQIGLNILDPTVHKIEANYDETDYGQHYGNGLRVLGAQYLDTASGFLSLNFRPILSNGIQRHESLNVFRMYFLWGSDHIPNREYYIDTLQDYHIELTKLDMESNIASGLFDFTMVSPDKADTIKITKGRFDVFYYPE